MKRPDTKAIRERVEKATPGEWSAKVVPGSGAVHVIDGQGIASAVVYDHHYPALPNAHFIAHAHQDVPELLDYIGDLKALLIAAANMLDKAAAKPFIMGKGAAHWDEVQAMIDRMREEAKTP